ncbi:MAG: magnesium transporter [bacterium]|nr:magnesium transporter [bacterium]
MAWEHEVSILAIKELISKGSFSLILKILDDLQAIDIAEILLSLDEQARLSLFLRFDRELSARVFEQLDPKTQGLLLEVMEIGKSREILGDMSSDDLADLVGELAPQQAQAVLGLIPHEDAEEIRELLVYPEHSAGGLMTTEYIALSESTRVDDAINYIRQTAATMETVYSVYVTKDDALVGVVGLRALILASPESELSQLMDRHVIAIGPLTDQEEVASILSKYDFLSLPIVDQSNRLLGLVTIDDILDVLSDEATEDISKFGGSVPLNEPYIDASIFSLFSKRVGWLLVLFVAQLFTSTLMKSYEDVLHSVVSLVFFIPLLIGTGGNAGSQASSLVIRGMATGEVGFKDVLKVFKKELSVGLALGLAMGAVTFLRALMMGESVLLALSVSVTLFAILIMAALTGSMLPLAIRRVGLDPAVGSSPLITTIVDTAGLFIYFTVAAKLLGVL